MSNAARRDAPPGNYVTHHASRGLARGGDLEVLHLPLAFRKRQLERRSGELLEHHGIAKFRGIQVRERCQEILAGRQATDMEPAIGSELDDAARASRR